MLFKHRLPLALCLSLTLWAAGCQPQPTTEPTMTPDVPSSPGAGKNDKSAQQHLYRLNPTPRQGYEIVLTIWVFRTNVTGDFGIVTENFGPS
ncbi:hypothetical protein [Hydrogenophaga sp.]|uniref:hypothetical protein n=1 Tax=Hydrogenophaga sp. TaxID=1904254 RepID=UPI002734B7ED|nr:hypothetical protein [Hydrogenophaga sp.]MDP3887811.1 hypothetical protein [Hydrogenophaga sp.]MDZ4400151.1 hypothetical protein [Hydrogenophaga sp.]